MALTRRTARFGELAQAVEARLSERGVTLEADVVDRILRHRVDTVAAEMGLTPRTALAYAPDDLPEILANTVIKAIETMPPDQPAPRPELRVIPPRD
jgi:hypothetical protein